MYAYVILGLLLAVLATDLAGDTAPPDAAATFLATAGAAVTVMVAGLAISGYIMLRRESIETDEQRFLRGVGRLGKLYRLFVVAAYAALLFVFDWAALAMHWAAVGDWMAPPLAVMIVPFVLLLVVAWTSLYWADRSLRTLMFERAGADSSKESATFGGAAVAMRRWTLPRYLEFMARQYLLVVLAPVLVLLTVTDAVACAVGPPETNAVAALLDGGLLFAAFLLAGPWVRVCWRTEAMPDCPLRDRLLALVERADVRVANILVWRTNLSIANGCMIGLVGRFRYILITDALLLSLSPEEVEAVFAHEVAHIKHRHVLLYLVMAMIGAGVAHLVLVTGFVGVPWLWEAVLVGSEPPLRLGFVVSLCVLAAWWWFGFGYLSRRCEQECDLYAVRATACPAGCSPADAGPRASVDSATTSSVCEHRVATFVAGLRRIARLNGAAETARGWRHFSIARRCRFLLDVLARPAVLPAAEGRLRCLKVAVLVTAVAVALGAGAVMAVDELLQPHEPEDSTSPEHVVPWDENWIVCLVDRDEADRLALGPPQFGRHANAAANLHDGRPAGLRGGASPGDDDVAVADTRRHALAVGAQGERAGLHGAEAGNVHELDHPVGRGRG